MKCDNDDHLCLFCCVYVCIYNVCIYMYTTTYGVRVVVLYVQYVLKTETV
jgi:hypothetical protein